MIKLVIILSLCCFPVFAQEQIESFTRERSTPEEDVLNEELRKLTIEEQVRTKGRMDVDGDIYPGSDDTHYLGKNDDDDPFAWKGVILKDINTGTYYRLEIASGSTVLTDLTD
jgi:hypothetical protein